MIVFVITDYKGVVRDVVSCENLVRVILYSNPTYKYKIKDLSEWVGLYKGDIT